MPSTPTGLDDQTVAQRRATHGFNDMADRETHGFWRTIQSVATEPMFLLLIVAAAIYLVIGDLGEGLLLAFFAVVTVGLVIFQERRSERALDALRELAAPQVRVLRQGQTLRIPARELVPGDWFWLAEGERVAADAVLRQASSMSVDESLLTGESVPVRKAHLDGPAPADTQPPGGDDSPFVYASTLVVDGHGLAEVLQIGRATRVGQIGASLATIEMAPTPLEQHLRKLVRVFGVMALVFSVSLVLWYGLLRGQWVQGTLSGIALGMAMLPEEFPMALAVFLAMGAWRLARIQVLAKRPAVIEALGAATVLCVDKTGTLTENRMRLSRLVCASGEQAELNEADLPEFAHRLLETAMLASRRGSVDPMDRAVLAAGDRALAESEHLHPDWQLQREYPLSPALLAMSHAWTMSDGRCRVAAKGAPEAIADLCHFPPETTQAFMQQAHALAEQGFRVLAVAEGVSRDGAVQGGQHDYDFVAQGFLAFEDPLRASVPVAVAEARQAGIQVAMITGDHAATALAIARQAGIDITHGALSGEQLAQMDDADLALAVGQVRVFARVMPEQKLRLVQAFQSRGEVVAMTGDGVNDAPALKAAHIGIAMGARGTDVAREAAGLVLLDEDFGRIVGGVRMGRRIFDNLRKVMTYITAIHVPIAGLALLPVLMGLPPLMLPVHVVLTEMVIDPVCSLAFEGAPEDPSSMQRPPRKGDDSIVGWPMLLQGLWQGGLLLAATLAIYGVALHQSMPEDVARTLAIVSLTLGNLLLVGTNASTGLGWRALLGPGFGAFWVVSGITLTTLCLGVLAAPVRQLLHFGQPTWDAMAAAVSLVALAVAVGAWGLPQRR